MDLYFMRHGIASPLGTSGIKSDRERPLTQKGLKRMRKAAKGLSSLGIRFGRILTSPSLRARQTAQLVAKELNMEEQLEEVKELAPEGSVQGLLSSLTSYRAQKQILLVGHEPLLSETISFLLSEGNNIRIGLKKGGLCYVEVDDLPPQKGALLHWMLTPKQLRLLSGS